VRVNDRGPYVDGRVLDLSREAARVLGMVERGVVPVRLEPVEQ
jgi:rare lipoprotein A